MARCTIQPGAALRGTIRPPPSYAHALRLIWGACLGAGGNIGNCPDRPAIRALLSVGAAIGAEPQFENNVADIFGPGGPYPADSIDCQSNAYATRFGLPLAALFGSPVNLNGTSLPDEASQWLDATVPAAGLRMSKTGDRISIEGPPTSDGLLLNDRAGAFWAPGWMMALPLAEQSLVLQLDDFTRNHPAVRLTLGVFDQFGIIYTEDESDSTLTIAPQQEYPARYMDVESDWRTGSYLLGALMLSGTGQVELSSFSRQPERNFWKLFEAHGLLSWSPDGLSVSPSTSRSFEMPPELDVRPYPALLPLLIVLATQSSHPVRIGPLTPISPRTLIRAKLMEKALVSIGAQVQVGEAWIEISPSKLTGGTVDCSGEPRVAMALGLAGLVASGALVIEDAQAVSDIHAGFWADLRRLGANAVLSFPRPAGATKEESTPAGPNEGSRSSQNPPEGSQPRSPARKPPEGPLSNDDAWHSI